MLMKQIDYNRSLILNSKRILYQEWIGFSNIELKMLSYNRRPIRKLKKTRY